MGVDKCWVRRASSLALVLAVGLWLAPSALASPAHITSASGLSDIWIGDNLDCQVVHSGVGVGDFFGGQTTGPASCGTTLSLTGSAAGAGVYGLAGAAFTPVSGGGPTRTGSGTQADPYVVTTTVSAGSTGVNVTETDTYVAGNEFYRTAITVTNTSSSAWSGAVYHSGDCYLNGSDSSYGALDATNQTVACTQNPNNSPVGGLMQFAALTAGSHYFEGGYSAADGTYPSGQQDYPDTCDCTTFEDTGMGINWDFTLAPGAFATFTLDSTFTAEVTAAGGQSFSGNAPYALNSPTVATFTDTNTTTSTQAYSATIDWGDGTPTSTGTISGGNGSFTVTGSHTYSSGGNFTITVRITPASGNAAVVTDSAAVAGIAATGGQSFSGTAPFPVNDATVANFTATNPEHTASDYTATIDWGDGTATSAGTISGSSGSFSVTGSHTYTTPGDYTITVTITPKNAGENTATATDSAAVGGIGATGGQAFSGVAPLSLSNANVASFTAANTGNAASNYMATIDWGDGTSTSTGTISGGNGSFSVTGSHTYPSPGSFTIQVTITDTSNSANTATATDSATVTSPPSQAKAPTPVLTGTPSVTSSSTAVLTGSANPNNLPTTGHWIYGVDASERGPGFNGNVYDQSTPDQPVGSDSTSHTISLPVTGLLPNTLYRVRFVATNSAGQTVGPDQTFTTPSAPVQPVPPLGTENFTPSGKVFVLIGGKFVKLNQTLQLPSGTVVDARQGSLTLVSSSAGGGQATDAKAKKGKKKIKTFTGTFGGAVFQVNQTTSGPNRGLTTLSLVEGITGTPSYASCNAKGASEAHAALSGRILQTLRSRASGRYRTRGRYAAGTVRGTAWTTTDRCDGTLIAVQQHSVEVTDLVKHKTILVRAGHSYLARAPKGRKH